MASIIKVNTIQDATNSNTALSIDSSGRVLTPAKPAFMARRTSQNNAGIVIFDTAVVNQGGHYDTSNGRFTAPIAGIYVFSVALLSDHDGTDAYFGTELFINGQSYAKVQNRTELDNDFTGSFTTVASLSVADYVQVSNGVPTYGTTSPQSNFSHFSGFLLG